LAGFVLRPAIELGLSIFASMTLVTIRQGEVSATIIVIDF
jgi:hypothetical protein